MCHADHGIETIQPNAAKVLITCMWLSSYVRVHVQSFALVPGRQAALLLCCLYRACKATSVIRVL
jgi:hypothetical protein